jgi:hypothetical protein
VLGLDLLAVSRNDGDILGSLKKGWRVSIDARNLGVTEEYRFWALLSGLRKTTRIEKLSRKPERNNYGPC